MNIEDIDQNLVDKVNNHIKLCGFGKILAVSEDNDYVYFTHYGDNNHNINDIWINITSKKYLEPYSYEYYIFLEKNKNNFSLSIKDCIMSENDKSINWIVELSISDLKDEIQIAGCNLHNIDYELYTLFRRARKLPDDGGIYAHFMMLIDIDLIANVQEDLTKKIANYKKN